MLKNYIMISNKNINIFKQTYKLFLKYKLACILYLLIVLLVYPVYFFFNDYNYKTYSIKFNYVTLLPTTDMVQERQLNITNYNKKINNEIKKQINSTKLLRENVSIKCTLVELNNTCRMRVKNWSEKKADLLKKNVLTAVKTVTVDLKAEINQQINLLMKSLNNASSTNEILDFNYKIKNQDIKNLTEMNRLAIESMELKLQIMESINSGESELISLKKNMFNLEKFEKEILKDISETYFSYENNFSSYEHYSLRKHMLTIILGTGFLFFGLLILIS